MRDVTALGPAAPGDRAPARRVDLVGLCEALDRGPSAVGVGDLPPAQKLGTDRSRLVTITPVRTCRAWIRRTAVQQWDERRSMGPRSGPDSLMWSRNVPG